MAKKTEKKNELITSAKEAGFLAFGDEPEVREALAANFGDTESITVDCMVRVKVPSSGATRWTIEELEGELLVDELVGLVVHYAAGGVLWPTNDPVEGTQPVLRTDDLITAYRIGDDLGDIDPEVIEKFRVDGGGYDWQALAGEDGPFGWGSGKGGRGKRAHEFKTIALLRESDILPILLNVPPTSIKPVSSFIKKLTGRAVPWYRSVIGLSLEEDKNDAGQKFSKIKTPRLVGTITREEAELARKLYRDPIKRALSRETAFAPAPAETAPAGEAPF